MREHPILFSDTMVRAILAGTKTQTRRVIAETSRGGVKLLSRWAADPFVTRITADEGAVRVVDRTGGVSAPLLICPYGAPGHRLWVREAWSTEGRPVEEVRAEHEDAMSGGASVYYRATEVYPSSLRWRPSIHMPRWASRLSLEITSVRVERVQAISEEDARAEGFTDADRGHTFEGGRLSAALSGTCRGAFGGLWDSINGERPGCSWAANPWVWVLRFQRIDGVP